MSGKQNIERQYLTRSVELLGNFNVCKSLAATELARLKRKLDNDVQVGLRIGYFDGSNFPTNKKPKFSNPDNNDLEILNIPNLNVQSSLVHVIDGLQNYLGTLNHCLAKPSEAQFKHTGMISSAPNAYRSLTETPIFVPTNQPDLTDRFHGGKNNVDTHPNSLQGRNDSSLTMIASEVEWKEALGRNLIGFSKSKSKSKNKSAQEEFKPSYYLMDIGLLHKANDSATTAATTTATTAAVRTKKAKPLPSFIEVSIRGCCSYTDPGKTELKTDSCALFDTFWFYSGCRESDNNSNGYEVSTFLYYDVFLCLLFEALFEKKCKYPISVYNLQFYLIAKANSTAVSQGKKIKDDDGFRQIFCDNKSIKKLSDNSSDTYVSLMLSFPASTSTQSKLTQENIDSYKASISERYKRYNADFLRSDARKCIANLIGAKSANVYVSTPNINILDEEGDGSDFIHELHSPDTAQEKGVAGVKSVTTSTAFSRVVGLLNTTPGSPYYHSMTDVMARQWVDFLMAFRSKEFCMKDAHISATDLLTEGYLESRNWLFNFDVSIKGKKRFQGLTPHLNKYEPSSIGNALFMLHADALKLFKSEVEDYDVQNNTTQADKAIVQLANSLAEKNSNQLPNKINFIRYDSSGKIMHEYTSNVDNGNNESLSTILSKDKIGDDNFNRLFEFTQEQYSKFATKEIELTFRFLCDSSSTSSSSQLSYRVYRSSDKGKPLKNILDDSALAKPCTCQLIIENKKIVSDSSFTW